MLVVPGRKHLAGTSESPSSRFATFDRPFFATFDRLLRMTRRADLPVFPCKSRIVDPYMTSHGMQRVGQCWSMMSMSSVSKANAHLDLQCLQKTLETTWAEFGRQLGFEGDSPTGKIQNHLEQN